VRCRTRILRKDLHLSSSLLDFPLSQIVIAFNPHVVQNKVKFDVVKEIE